MLSRVAVLFIIINLFNLLPLLPLDGGWFWHSILFSRNRWAELAFRALTALLLIILSVTFLNSVLLAVVATFMLLATRRTFHAARIAQELRAEQVIPADAPPNEIPPEFTENVVARVNTAMPKGKMNVQQMAQVVLDVYDRVTVKPAGMLESLALALVYLGAIVLGIGVVILPMIMRRLV
jgi:hypothetical protein